MDNLETKVDNAVPTWQQIKPRLIEILITAALSAALAFLQSLITHWGGFNNPVANPEVAAGIGAAIRTVSISTKATLC